MNEMLLWPTKSTPPLLVIEHDLSRSTTPLSRTLLHDALYPKDTSKTKNVFQNVVLVTLLHPLRVFVRDPDLGLKESRRLKIIDSMERKFGEVDEMKVINEFRVQCSETLLSFGTVLAAVLEKLISELGSLASVYHKPAETFVGKGHMGAESLRKNIPDQNEEAARQAAIHKVVAGQQAENLLEFDDAPAVEGVAPSGIAAAVANTPGFNKVLTSSNPLEDPVDIFGGGSNANAGNKFGGNVFGGGAAFGSAPVVPSPAVAPSNTGSGLAGLGGLGSPSVSTWNGLAGIDMFGSSGLSQM